MIIVVFSYSKRCVFEIFSVHTNTQNQRSQIPPVSRAFSKNSVFETDQWWMESFAGEINELCFQIL